MSATTSGALKARIESLGLGLSAYRDEAPAGTARPYVTIIEEIALVADPSEDGVAATVVETTQVDLWQDWHDAVPASPTYGQIKESYSLAAALRRGIDGSRLAVIGTSLPYTALVRHTARLLEPEENVVHHALTVEVWRQA